MEADSGFLIALVKIMWINILLSGDNAVVIALACRGLPGKQRTYGVLLGAAVAVLMRIGFTVVVAQLMALPFLKAIGAVLLFWIAIQLLLENDGDQNIKETSSLWNAVRTVAIADLVMSLDNVIAIAAAARGDYTLIIIGLALSVPLIVFGATLIIKVLERFPWLVWFGAALLGWVAGELIPSDPGLTRFFGADNHMAEYAFGIAGAILVVGVGWFFHMKKKGAHAEEA